MNRGHNHYLLQMTEFERAQVTAPASFGRWKKSNSVAPMPLEEAFDRELIVNNVDL